MLGCFSHKRVLLLQGPIGPFFRRLRRALRRHGAQVFKINFCGGDELFYPWAATSYRGSDAGWPAFLGEYLERHQIDAIMLFGDCRRHHLVASELARARSLPVYAFEEGYLRPDFVTVEVGGVNSHSSLPKDPEIYRRFSPHPASRRKPERVRHAFGWTALYACLYTAALHLMRWRFPNYVHHRSLHPARELLVWSRAAWRKLEYAWTERHVLDRLTAPGAPGYFLVPLQVHSDAQVSVHSRFGCVSEFIETVLTSFARHAPSGTLLVLKHHPLDRGHRDYSRFIADVAAQLDIASRVVYVHDVHLPRLLDFARGTVVINSTVGLSSVHHGTPVHVLGKANYTIPGLVHQDTLDAFWDEPGEVDAALYRSFRAWLTAYNQANGSFYAPLAGCSESAGLRWPPLFPPPEVEAVQEHPQEPAIKTVSV